MTAVHAYLQAGADQWWNALIGNDEATVCDAVNVAFSDNPAAGYALGLDGSTLSVVMRQQDLESLPSQTPGLTSAGRPTLKNLTNRDRMGWWLTIMASNMLATCKEAFAVAPAVTEVNLAVLTRLPSTYRLGIVSFGTWSRQAIESIRSQTPEDALRCFDIGRDVRCSVKTTAPGSLSSTLKPLNTSGVPGLDRFLDDHTEDDGTDPLGDIVSAMEHHVGQLDPIPNPYEPLPFSQWLTGSFATPPLTPVDTVQMTAGQNVALPEVATHRVEVAFTFSGADADLTLLLVGSDGKVASDEDFVFYNQPNAPGDVARLLGKTAEQGFTTERAVVHLSAMPSRVKSVVISLNMDVASNQSCAALVSRELAISTPDDAWTFGPPPDAQVSAMVVAEFYRRIVDGEETWKLRALGHGWSDGLDGLARSYGVDVT